MRAQLSAALPISILRVHAFFLSLPALVLRRFIPVALLV
jgi:hypothetical protein